MVPNDLWSRLDELEGNILGCWCSPGMCHAHTLILLLWMKRKEARQLEHGDSNFVKTEEEVKTVDDVCATTPSATTALMTLVDDKDQSMQYNSRSDEQYYRVETTTPVVKFPKPPLHGPQKTWYGKSFTGKNPRP